ncbi:MAG: hypothetical protein CBARDCOR_6317 [uncultured Caballeronia sp.]|nr:MAG: hypothetical protein CBARDCOR_6317 [uncultured Caballeronia sp.]
MKVVKRATASEYTCELADLDSPTESSMKLVAENDGTFSVPILSNALVKFDPAMQTVPKMGDAPERF